MGRRATRFDVTDPATGLKLADVANLARPTRTTAIVAADKAWPAWRAKTAKERHAILMKWFALLHQHADDLARIMTAEQGKPLAEARARWATAPASSSGLPKKAGASTARPSHHRQQQALPRHQAADRRVRGDHAVELPDRDDHAQGGAGAGRRLPGDHQAGRADAAVGAGRGRTGAARRHARRRAEHPHRRQRGSIEIGKVLCASDVVRHLSFTGSTEVGRILAAQCAPTIKKISLELGGNAPFIVFDDADIDSAVEGAMVSKYRNAGQTCVCANRLYVQAGVYDAFVEKLAAKSQTIKVGNGFEAGVNQGPLIDDQAIAKVESHVADALAKGARWWSAARASASASTPPPCWPT
jgi:succinate-semialdehyde dehydrogenase/glutarate-semialdehyde dehydrogenase